MALLREAGYDGRGTSRRGLVGPPPMLPGGPPRVQAGSLQGQIDWPLCNAHKGPNIAGIDTVTNRLTALFHPRRHKGHRHFRWNGPILLGRHAIGRATARLA